MPIVQVRVDGPLLSQWRNRLYGSISELRASASWDSQSQERESDTGKNIQLVFSLLPERNTWNSQAPDPDSESHLKLIVHR